MHVADAKASSGQVNNRSARKATTENFIGDIENARKKRILLYPVGFT
jgi:hypothetical protein